MIKICARCGKEFEARHGNAKYCSDDCRREVIYEQHAAWSQNNADKHRELKRRWEIENPEKRKESVRRWRSANPEKVRECSRNWRERNPEKHHASFRNWYLTKGKHKLWVKKRAARLRKILEEKAAARQAQQPKRERHWTDNVSFPLVSSCSSTYIY